MAAIAANQVTVIAGETGSGKTTQIPRMCLELGLGEKGLSVGRTPSRGAWRRAPGRAHRRGAGARSAEEVGFQVRFTGEVGRVDADQADDRRHPARRDQRDRCCKQYNTIIIDEAHERSLNIDFLLGYLKRLLPKRPDLKVIVTSATIDPERFSRHSVDARR